MSPLDEFAIVAILREEAGDNAEKGAKKGSDQIEEAQSSLTTGIGDAVDDIGEEVIDLGQNHGEAHDIEDDASQGTETNREEVEGEHQKGSDDEDNATGRASDVADRGSCFLRSKEDNGSDDAKKSGKGTEECPDALILQILVQH